ncbi:MAG: hypothetical protein RML94_00095 [Bacteroidia bacterium]|nr:hypothetical protein [Bacteroidia bacterium]
MNKVSEFLSRLLAGEVLKEVSSLLDEIITNKEERQALLNEIKKAEYAHIQEIEKIKLKALEAELAYKETELLTEVELRKQAVKLVTETNHNPHASWLTKNITAILALGSTLTAGVIYLLVLVGKLKATEPTVLLVVSNITNLVLVVFGFYFGSSVGSRLRENKIG